MADNGPVRFETTRNHRTGATADTLYITGYIGMYGTTTITGVETEVQEYRVRHEEAALEVDAHMPRLIYLYRRPPSNTPFRVTHEGEVNPPAAEDFVELDCGDWLPTPRRLTGAPDMLAVMMRYFSTAHRELNPPVALDNAHLWRIESGGDECWLVTPEGRYPLCFKWGDSYARDAPYFWQDWVMTRGHIANPEMLTVRR